MSIKTDTMDDKYTIKEYIKTLETKIDELKRVFEDGLREIKVGYVQKNELAVLEEKIRTLNRSYTTLTTRLWYLLAAVLASIITAIMSLVMK